MKKRIKIRRWLILPVLLITLLVCIFANNHTLECTTHHIVSDRLPDAFDGYKIAHISDLHNTENQALQKQLLQALEDAQPDMIAITGDLIDSRNTNIDVALHFVENAVKIAPCYFVPGNHEGRIAAYDTLIDRLSQLGVTVLVCNKLEIAKDGDSIALFGIQDPIFFPDDADYIIQHYIQTLCRNNDLYAVLLSHRPELFSVYAENGMDLVLTGHAHGGQFRLPWIGGIFAPHQGFFPKYDSGLFTENRTNMIVSRGIGNSLFPLRINNPPELIIIQLQTEK